ncbi:Ribose transport system permease protein RbsC [uncultured Pleomorphomonas sp.]|uniref:Ribose transport system permease protein RbsC n=1 Tax=uncultured Pleomorphomonas sp. TaxID=442121 RepID=A0A212LH28_9HYPH|nr:ABC transporter permease [uncultured Pleomorphomonas sp.]SCM76862.1 Ribose transport system permease protein RbsC [uncultured Pleomorphomonas sp.]
MSDRPTGSYGRDRFFQDFGLVLIFLIVVGILVVLSPDAFARPANMIGIIKQASINGVLAMGMMFVIISGGIDLSVGSIVAFTGVIAASLAHPGEYPLIVAIVAPILVGAAIGAVNGVSIAYGGIPPFIVTLASMIVFRGAALIASDGSPVFGVSGAFEDIAGGFVAGGLPYLAVYFIVVAAISAMILRMTVFGRRVYAIGGNATAAAVSGINVRAMQTGVYMISGALAGFAGLLLASRTVSGSPTAGEGYEMNAIAAVIIGGVSMSGGVGRWYGPVIGALLIAVIGNGLDILNVSSYYQLIIQGLIIYFAVLADVKGKAGRR